jgi:hypothetical protein
MPILLSVSDSTKAGGHTPVPPAGVLDTRAVTLGLTDRVVVAIYAGLAAAHERQNGNDG